MLRRYMLLAVLIGLGLWAYAGSLPATADQPATDDGAMVDQAALNSADWYRLGMQRYTDEDGPGALEAFQRVEAMELSKDQRVSMYEAIQDINRRAQADHSPADLIKQAKQAAQKGQMTQAADLYRQVTQHPRATAEQKKQAAAELAGIEKNRSSQLTQLRQQVDQAKADLDSNRIDDAERKLTAVVNSGVDLGWFDNERVERYLAIIAERRSQMSRHTSVPSVDEPVAEHVELDSVPESETHAEADQPVIPEVEIAAAAALDVVTTHDHAEDHEPVDVAPVGAGGIDLLNQAKQLRVQERIAQARQAEQGEQYHLAGKLYGDALALDRENQVVAEALAAVQAKADNDLTPKSVLETEIHARTLRARATIAEFEQLMNRGTRLLESRNFTAAREAVQQAKITLDLNERFLPSAQYQGLREKAVNLAARIADAERVAIDTQIREIEQARESEAETRRTQALQEQREEIQQLLRRAANLRREQKYDQALELLNQALFLDPTNIAAQAMKEMIEDSRLYVEARERFRERNLLIAQSSSNNLDATKPYTDLVTYPADWPQLTNTRLSGLEEFTSESEINRQVTQKLRDSVPIKFDNSKLVDVVDYLRNTTGLNFFVNWTALQNVGIERDTAISLQLSNVPIEQALRLVLQQASAANELEPAGFSIIEGVVTISTERDLSRTTDIRPYDIRDLLVQVPTFTDAPEFDLRAALTFSEGDGAEIFSDSGQGEETISREELVAQIMSLIRDTVGDALEWADAGGDISSMRELNGNLIVKTTPKNHRLISKLLRQLRETRALQIAIEARFLLVDQNFLDEVGVDLDVTVLGDNSGRIQHSDITVEQSSNALTNRQVTSLTPDSFLADDMGQFGRSLALGGSFMYLDDFEVNFMIDATQASRRAITLTAPRLTLFNGQRGYVIVARQIAFISDLEPIPDAAGFSTTVAVTQSGVILDVEGTVSADRRYVTLTVRPSLATLVQNPPRQVRIAGIATLDLPGEENQVLAFPIEGFIELPELELTSVKTTVSVPDRGTLLLGGQRLVNDIEIEAGVPVLSKVPVLNRLFTNKSTIKDERTLLILIKPTIIVQSEEEDERFPGLMQDPHKFQIGQILSR